MVNPQSPIRNPQSAIPPAFLDRMAGLLGDEYGAFAASLDLPPSAGLRVNSLKVSSQRFRELSSFPLEPLAWPAGAFLLQDETREPGEDALAPGKHPHHAAGLYYLQDPSAMVAAETLDPQPGERILDLAAAPGGKATHIASLMRNEGLLVANEIHGQRVRDLAENLERWGARNAVITNESPERLAGRFAGFFDRVLLDAPCSGEGMFRRSEAARREWSPELVHGCALRQTHILAQAARLVRPGGRLVYSTCTFAPEENEGVISQFLGSRPDFAMLEPLRHPGFADGRPDWAAYGGARPHVRRAIRLWPHCGVGEGHFIAVLQRAAGGAEGIVSRWRPERLSKSVLSLYRAFCEETLAGLPGEDDLALVGAYLYAVPPEAPDLAGLRFIHPGWWLGVMKKDRFEPSHALALGLSLAEVRPERVVRLESGGREVAAYLRGESLPMPGAPGWVLVAVDGFPLGWGKRVAGVVKSRYPKGLRWTESKHVSKSANTRLTDLHTDGRILPGRGASGKEPMSDDAKRRGSQDRVTSGGYLSSEERDALEAVYAQRDETGMAVLREAAAGGSSYPVRPAGLSAADRQVAATFKCHLAEIGRPVDFRVFGSRARGDATGESDLDIFIELETASPAARRQIDDLAWEIGFSAGMVISPFVVARDEIETGPVGANPIIQRIMAEGVAV